MKRILPILLLLILSTSCKSKKRYSSKPTTKTVRTTPNVKPAKNALDLVKYAKRFQGTKYKYGGTTKRGMDCSGLIYTTFTDNNLSIPRTTRDLAKYGDWIDLKKVNVGDLVFFATSKNSRKVNHVGLVTNVRTGNVEFIHASSSRGVMISSLAERYWYFAFVQARRVL